MTIRLGIIGLSPGNGHPYSWSAICNGYNSLVMQDCGFPTIPEYLSKQNWPEAKIDGVQVTHVWTQDRGLSEHIASASLIPYVVDKPEQMLPYIDGLLLARDDAINHQSLVAPFLRAGVPVYIDKPIALNLSAFDELHSLQVYPGQIFSCSALRFSPEFQVSEGELSRIGPLQLVTGTIPKYWATYSIHLIDPLLNILGPMQSPKVLFDKTLSDNGRIMGLKFGEGGPQVILTTLGGLCQGPAELRFHGRSGWISLEFHDSFTAFRAALSHFIEGIGSGSNMDGQAFNRRAVEILEMSGHD